MLRLLSFCLFAVLVAAAAPLRADTGEASASTAQATVRDGYWELDADIDLALNRQLREAAERGIALYFTFDLSVTQPRWWWFDRVDLETTRTWRVLYNALTRQWRVGTGELSLPVASLDEAMDVVRHVRGWRFAPAEDLTPDAQTVARVRLRLDNSFLAKPFQVNALNSSSWSVSSPWLPVVLIPPAAPPPVVRERPAEVTP